MIQKLLVFTFILGISTISNAQETGTFTDHRDGRTYKTVKIGDQWFMAENLAFKPANGNFWAYKNDSNNILAYGYLYDWGTAKNVAPIGWHLPSLNEWKIMFDYLGGNKNIVFEAVKPDGKSGFNALFGGTRSENGDYNDVDESVFFWSSTSYDETVAYCLGCEKQNKKAALGGSYKVCGFSIRCIKDN
jgi:uncharacterized protein (TIGR02145 family)